MKHKYTIDQLKNAIASSISYRQVLKKLQIVPAGGNYSTLRKRIRSLSIDILHFKHQASNKGKRFPPKRPISDYLSNKQAIGSYSLKLRLIRESILPKICDECKLTEWHGKPTPLELHHIDGNTENNNLSNLRLICPNCHALTVTYRGKNKGNNNYQ